jgi:hypothetical protein
MVIAGGIGLTLLLGWLAQPAPRVSITQAASDLTIYGDALAAGWADWSWGTTRNLSNASPVQGGTASISVKYEAAWAGFYLHANTPVDLANYDRLRFWIHGGSAGSQRLRVVANGSDPSIAVTANANQWKQVEVLLSSLGDPASLNDLYWQDTTGGGQAVFYLDGIVLVARTSPPPLTATPGSGPALSVNVAANRKPISPHIYGLNFADEALANELDLPINRWGGNATTRYNYLNDTYNTASDWYFQNIPNANSNVGALPAGSASDKFVEQNNRTATESILTAPHIGWVAKRRPPTGGHPYDCGFSLAKYGAQQTFDPWDPDCGNGVRTNGSNVTGNDPADTSVAITPSFVQGWVNHLKSRFGTAANGGVQFYNLDNEPMLWNSTHRDVHPNPVTYNELRDRTYQYAAALKQADSTALTLGPVLWGWCAYWYSAADNCAPGSDYQSHGNTPFSIWYLQQMKAYEQANGVRLLDYLDWHYYPQASGVALQPAGNTNTQALRLRSTRSLWDASYVDESWIAQSGPDGGVVRLIPRMREWVNAHYPGTKLAITEYNWGGLEHLNGALAQADVLGIFGREGLDLATLWAPPESDQPGVFAFRVYRNYDGNGSKFGETSVQASSTDQDKLAIYAAQRNGDQALTVVVINKTGGAISSNVALAGFSPAPSAQVYRYSGANLNALVAQPSQTVLANGFSATFPANSITLFVIQPGTPLVLDKRVYLPVVRR